MNRALSPETVRQLRARGWAKPDGSRARPYGDMPIGAEDAPLPPQLTTAAVDQLVEHGDLPPGTWTPQQAADMLRDPNYQRPVPRGPTPPPSTGTGKVMPTPTAQSMFGLGQPDQAAQSEQAKGFFAASQRAGNQAKGVFDGAAKGAGTSAAGGMPDLPKPTVTPAHAVSRVSPEVREEFDRGAKTEAAGAAEEARAAVRANDVAANAMQQQRDAEEDATRALQEADQRRSAALNAQADEYKRLQQEAASQKVDPNQWWGSKSEGAKVAAVIAIGLGALGSGISHGRNPNWASDMINERIRQNIDAQKSNIDQKNAAAAQQGNLYKAKMAQFGDEHAAELATHAQLLEQYKLTAQSEALRAQSPMLQAKAKQLAGQLGLKQAELHKELEAWQPATMSGGVNAAEVTKRAVEIRNKGAENGQAIDPAEARRQAVADLMGIDYKGASYAKEAAKKPTAAGTPDVPTPASTAYDPSRVFQGTDAYGDKLKQGQWNVGVLSAIHKATGIRGENLENAAEAYRVQPGDTTSTVRQKVAAFRANYPKTASADGATATVADEEAEDEK